MALSFVAFFAIEIRRPMNMVSLLKVFLRTKGLLWTTSCLQQSGNQYS